MRYGGHCAPPGAQNEAQSVAMINRALLLAIL